MPQVASSQARIASGVISQTRTNASSYGPRISRQTTPQNATMLDMFKH